MDQDGANTRYLTNGDALVLTPRFSPTAQEITYLSYFNNTPRVCLFNIESGRQELLGNFKGMTFRGLRRMANPWLWHLRSEAIQYLVDGFTDAQIQETDDPSSTSPSASPDSVS